MPRFRLVVAEELARYAWEHVKWLPDKLTASSPFRDGDRTASFYVWLEDSPTCHARAGDWGDSGAVDDEWRRGSFVKLLAFLRQETVEETQEYLRDTYESEETAEERLTLTPPRLVIPTRRKHLNIQLLDSYAYRHPYLARRGIAENVQRAMRVGYDRARAAVTLPWFTADGRLANILYRSVRSKVFWYEKGGMPIRELLYGIDVIYRRKVKRAALVEAPIDALFLMSCGIPAVAVGGASFNGKKRDLIIRSGIKELTLFTDQDRPGEEMKRKAIELLTPYVALREVSYPPGCKDPCDVGDRETIQAMYTNDSLRNEKIF